MLAFFPLMHSGQVGEGHRGCGPGSQGLPRAGNPHIFSTVCDWVLLGLVDFVSFT